MSHRKDLSPYSDKYANLLNVGWLDCDENYPQGETSQEYREALAQHIRYSAVQTLGRHECNLCKKKGHHAKAKLEDGSVISLGSCEIMVFAENGAIHAAPNLIYHYVMECNYLPPEPFIEAVVRSPRPPSDEYIAHFSRLADSWFPSLLLVEMLTQKLIWSPPGFIHRVNS